MTKAQYSTPSLTHAESVEDSLAKLDEISESAIVSPRLYTDQPEPYGNQNLRRCPPEHQEVLEMG